MNRQTRTVVIGAGPYGLATSAHLRHAGIDTKVFGRPMEFWQDMPRGMFLRSSARATSISDPRRRLTIGAYGADAGRPVGTPIRLEEFVAYGKWFQERVASDLDRRRVTRVSRHDSGFSLELEDGSHDRADNVVVAAGLCPFPRVPRSFAGLPSRHVSHVCEHTDLGPFSGQRVAVVGLGQSALECAALLRESGAAVEVIGRSQLVNWLPTPPAGFHRARQRLYPPTDVGGLLNGWLAAVPDAFRRAPANKQPVWARNAIRPAGAYWLRPRLSGVQISTGVSVTEAEAHGDELHIRLSDGTSREVDHALLATGYQIDVSKYPFLDTTLVAGLRRRDGYPILRPGLESSVPGLYFVGAPAAVSFGPVMRFVVGSAYAAPAVARSVAQRRQRLISFAF